MSGEMDGRGRREIPACGFFFGDRVEVMDGWIEKIDVQLYGICFYLLISRYGLLTLCEPICFPG